MTPLWIHLDFPLLALERHPGEEETPRVLLTPAGERVLLANGAAVAAGISSEMALTRACALCPHLIAHHPAPRQEQTQLEQLALWAGRFSAQVALQPPQGLLLEAASMQTHFGGLAGLCQNIERQLRTLRFSSRLATGHTPLAAAILARSGGFVGTTPAQHLARLKTLDPRWLELEPRCSERLLGMGIDTLGKLLALPRNDLAPRFGQTLLTTLDRLCGRRADPPRTFQPPPRFQQTLELDQELENAPALLFPLRRLLESLEGYLQGRQRRALALRITLKSRQGHGLRLEIGHREGAWRAREWLELCRLRLERERLQQPVTALILEADRLGELAPVNSGLFENPAPDGGSLLNRLQNRLGTEQIHRLAAVADHRPERGWRFLPVDQVFSDQEPAPLPGIPGRPGWLLHSPRPLSQRQLQWIERLEGPERIVSGWWDQAFVRRDYYQGRWPDGRLGWLFRDDRGDWYLHGWFG